VRATKNPGAVSRPGGWRSFGEYAFLEDSSYASQEKFDAAAFLAFPEGDRAIGVDST
jgi:hypothetical protein